MLRQKHILILDVDDTLYPVECGLLSSMRDLLLDSLLTHERLKDKFSAATMSTLGQCLDQACRMMREMNDGTYEVWQQSVYDLDYSRIRANPELVSSLHAARAAGIEIFLYSNGPLFHIHKVLERIGLEQGFIPDDHICGDLEPPKPSQEGFDLFLAKFGIHPHRAVFVDDRWKSLIPAQNRGITTVLLNNKNEAPANSDDGPDYVVHSLAAFIWSMAAEHADLSLRPQAQAPADDGGLPKPRQPSGPHKAAC